MNLICKLARALWLFAIVAAITLVWGKSSLAIPNQHLNPHSDAAADISWPNPAPAVPNNSNHFHLKLRGGETITQAASSISSNQGWAADSVCDDQFYRSQDTPAADGGANALASNFGHGYIDPTFVPTYSFSNVPALAQPILIGDFGAWNTAAKNAATAVGNQTPAGTPTTTSIAFANVANGGQFKIQFYNNFQATQNAFAEWMPSAEQISAGSPVAAGDIMVMGYEANPTNRIDTRGPWQLRTKAQGANPAGPWQTSLSQAVGWSYGAAAPVVAS